MWWRACAGIWAPLIVVGAGLAVGSAQIGNAKAAISQEQTVLHGPAGASPPRAAPGKSKSQSNRGAGTGSSIKPALAKPTGNAPDPSHGGARKPARRSLAQEYRRLADLAVTQGHYADAARYYTLEAGLYRQHNWPNAAKVEELKAERWSVELELYADARPNRRVLQKLYTGGKFEPLYGCYLGAFAVTDYSLPKMRDSNGKSQLLEVILGQVAHKHLASAFNYCFYGQKFPATWAGGLCQAGIAPNIALEPNDGLDKVKDDEYLRKFARDAAAAGGPVFLRFASEMNGNWTPYHKDPGLYREKFRLVHDVMARLAPNVAMVWCVYEQPEYNINEYYPGDAYVDWVGINVYSVIHHNNRADYISWFENPATPLKYIYKEYADRKPIAICEYGATHREHMSPKTDYSRFAAGRIADLFASLPRRFPRIKMIYVFDCNNLEWAPAGRQVNDYSVTDNRLVLEAFQHAIAPDYFLPYVARQQPAELPTYVRRLAPGAVLRGITRLSAWVKPYQTDPDDRPTVIYAVDGKTIGKLRTPGDYGIDLDTSKFGSGRHMVSVRVLDATGNEAGRREMELIFLAPQSDDPAPAGRAPLLFLLGLGAVIGAVVCVFVRGRRVGG